MKLLLVACLLWTPLVLAQSTGPLATANRDEAHRVLAQTIAALGGQAWLDVQTVRRTARTAAFFHGLSTGATTQTTETTAFPAAGAPMRQRVDLDKGQVAQLYLGNSGWEITYRGKRDLPSSQLEDHIRWRDHSLRVALRRWYADPGTMLLYDGEALVERHLTDRVTLIHGNDDAITLEIDAATHLPLRLSFRWRDPQFHDKNLDALEYDNYRKIDGIATPFTVTWTHNGETVRQRYLQKVQYNPVLRDGLFNPDRAAAHLKK